VVSCRTAQQTGEALSVWDRQAEILSARLMKQIQAACHIELTTFQKPLSNGNL